MIQYNTLYMNNYKCNQMTVPLRAFGVFPAIESPIITIIARAIIIIKQIMILSVYNCFTKYFSFFSALDIRIYIPFESGFGVAHGIIYCI